MYQLSRQWGLIRASKNNLHFLCLSPNNTFVPSSTPYPNRRCIALLVNTLQLTCSFFNAFSCSFSDKSSRKLDTMPSLVESWAGTRNRWRNKDGILTENHPKRQKQEKYWGTNKSTAIKSVEETACLPVLAAERNTMHACMQTHARTHTHTFLYLFSNTLSKSLYLLLKSLNCWVSLTDLNAQVVKPAKH